MRSRKGTGLKGGGGVFKTLVSNFFKSLKPQLFRYLNLRKEEETYTRTHTHTHTHTHTQTGQPAAVERNARERIKLQAMSK